MRTFRFGSRSALAALLVLALGAGASALAQGEDLNTAWAAVLWDAYGGVYADWAFEAGVPEGYYVGVEPHGLILRTYVNDVAANDVASGASAFSEGAVIVKENHMPTGVDLSAFELQDPVPDFAGDLAAWTYMVKVPGFAPDTGDWFYGRIAADGSVLAGGSPQDCVGCHAQVEDNDWVFNAQLGD